MVRRIGYWALAGAGVAFFWFIYFVCLTWSAYHGGLGFNFSPAIRTMVDITVPIRPLLGQHRAITWYWSIVLNGTIYALAGLAVETAFLSFRMGLLRARH